jgi:phosphatidylinositol alpha-1,6-mannosyltransferase
LAPPPLPKADRHLTDFLLITEIFPPRHGGSGRWFAELYGRLPPGTAMVAAGDTVGAETFDRGAGSAFTIHRMNLSSPSWGLRSLTGLRFYLSSYRRLAHLVGHRGVRQVHCGRCLPEGVLGWLLSVRFGIDILCYVHGEDIQAAAESRELSWLVRRVLTRSRCLIANSHNTARLLKEQWQVPENRIAVLHPGMDAQRFVPAPIDDDFTRVMGWTGRKVILTVGRLQRRKGQDMLIRAMPAILSAHPSALYVVIGDGKEKAGLRALVNELNLEQNVQFLDAVDDDTMIRCYQQCTLFALPNRTDGSDIEGFGMVLAEAQSCGKAVLAGDSGGTRETMRVGESGMIVDCSSPEPLAEAVVSLLDAPERLAAMGELGREHVVTTLDWPVHVQAASRLFASLP